MPFNPAPKLIQEFVPLDLLVQTEAALKGFDLNEQVKWGLDQIHHAINLTKKELGHIIKEEEKPSQPSGQLHQRQNLPALEKTVRSKTTMARSLFADRGQLPAFQKVMAQSTAFLLRAQSVADLMGKFKDDDMVAAGRKELLKAIHVYKEAETRIADGGHPTLDPAIAKAARKVWTCYDNAVDILGIQMRIHGQTYNRVWASRPTVHTPLRFEPVKVDPSLPVAPKRPRVRKPKSKPVVQTQPTDEQKKQQDEEKAAAMKKTAASSSKSETIDGKRDGIVSESA